VKIAYKYKRHAKKISLIFNTIPLFKKKQRYVLHSSYKKKQKPKFTHGLITQKDIKYIVGKKRFTKSYQHGYQHTFILSTKKQKHEKNFKIKEFTNFENFKLLSNFYFKYTITN
jgi:hypothetical protein